MRGFSTFSSRPYGSRFTTEECAQKDQSIQRLRLTAKQNKTLKQKVRRLEKRVKVLEQQESERKRGGNDDPNDKSFLQVHWSKGGKQLTFEGMIAVAIRKNFSNIAQADLGATILEDLSRFAISRAETRTGTALVASSRLWFQEVYQDLVAPSNNDSYPFRLYIHSFREDATNSGILRQSKLGALILRSGTLRDFFSGEDSSELNGSSNLGDLSNGGLEIDWDAFTCRDWFDSIVRVADILPVEGSSSEITVGQTLKQLESLGCITWKQIQQDDSLQQILGCFSRPNSRLNLILFLVFSI